MNKLQALFVDKSFLSSFAAVIVILLQALGIEIEAEHVVAVVGSLVAYAVGDQIRPETGPLLKSRRFIFTVLSFGQAIAAAFGFPISAEVVNSLTAVVSMYVLGSSHMPAQEK